MGFTIMESFMDEVKIQSVVGLGTKVTMKKYIDKESKNGELEEKSKEEENINIEENKEIDTILHAIS